MEPSRVTSRSPPSASAAKASGSMSWGMTPRSSSTCVLVPARRPPRYSARSASIRRLSSRSRSSGVGTAAADQAAGGEHRVPERLGDQQVPAPLDLLGEAGEAPGRESDRGQEEEGGERDREPDAERPREAPPPRRAEANARHQLGREPEHAQHGRVEQHDEHAPHEQRHRTAQVDRRVNRRGARPAGRADTRSAATSPRDASAGCGVGAEGSAGGLKRQAVERRLLAARVEQSAHPARAGPARSAGRPRPS